jgi:hypothetical protein
MFPATSTCTSSSTTTGLTRRPVSYAGSRSAHGFTCTSRRRTRRGCRSSAASPR